MNFFERFLTDPVGVVVVVVLVLYLIKEAYGLWKWYKDRADDYHKDKSEDEDFRQRVCDIACTSEKHTETLEKISSALDGIIGRLETLEKHHDEDMKKEAEERQKDRKEAEKERKQDTVAIARAWLFRLYEELKDKPELTMAEYETFDDLANRYLSAGGNSVFRNKIIPEIRSKQIHK